MTKTGWIVFGVIIIVLAAALLWWSEVSAPSADQAVAPQVTTTDTASTTDQNQPAQSPAAPMAATVTYDGNAFSPAQVTIAEGGTVTWVDTSGQMWIASDPHPIHSGYDGTTRDQHCAQGYAGPAPFDECAGGTSFSFTFDKAGTWGYHDHLNHSATASVTVVAAAMPAAPSATGSVNAATSAVTQ